MTRRDTTPRSITELRQPHTVYLTNEVWEALERMHLQARLSSPAPPSKIEFIEEVLRAGMRRMAHAAPPSLPLPAAPALEVPPASNAATGISKEQEHEPSKRTAPVPSAPRRRPSPVERLLKASDPGHPAPIRSAAEGEGIGTK
jgi:hypothetical protein